MAKLKNVNKTINKDESAINRQAKRIFKGQFINLKITD